MNQPQLAPGPSKPWVLGLYLLLAAGFAIIQPLPHLPDEGAHVQYIDFLATELRLPLWQPTGGEAGYESQHPPLSYLLYAPAWRLYEEFGPTARYQLLRFTAVLVGLLWLLLCDRILARLLGDDPLRRYALASVAWMPLVLLYSCHANPDLVVGIGATLVLYLSWETSRGEPSLKRAAGLGAALAAAWLTKLSGLAALPVALAGYLLAARRATPAQRRGVARDAAVTAAVMVALIAPYLARNLVLYGRLMVKTAAPFGSALDQVASGRFEPFQLLWLTLTQTYLSVWTQPDWLPGWPLRTPGGPVLPVAGVVLFYGLLTALVVAAMVGLRRGVPPQVREFLALGAVLLVSLLAGHQLAFWTQDIEFNMGGRYLLSAMLVIALGVTAGLRRLDARLPALWLGLLLTMNAVAVPTILFILNPHYAPGWEVLTLR